MGMSHRRWLAAAGCGLACAGAATSCGSNPNGSQVIDAGQPDTAAPDAASAGDAASAADAPATDAMAPSTDAGLPPGIYLLSGEDAGLPVGDLTPLQALVGSATYIGLGESIHTSGGFYAMKNRVIRYMVENLGVRAIAMETPRTQAEAASGFIEKGQGTLDDAISGVFAVFVSPDTEALFQWLSDYDSAHPSDPVYFYGFDAQQPDDDSAILQAFLAAAAPADGPGLWAPIDRDCSLSGAGIGVVGYPGDFNACVAAVDALADYFTVNEATLVNATSSADFARANMAVISLKSWQGEDYYYPSDVGKSNEWRDQAMAQILLAMHAFRSPNAKTVVWAHNYHLSMHHWDVDTAGFGATMTMGSYLEQQIGTDYLAVAQTAYEVGISWPGFGYGYEPVPTDPTSLELQLHAFGDPYLLVDTHSPWITPGTTYEFGGETEIPAEQYRAFIYIDNSPPMDSPFWTAAPDGGTTYTTLAPTPSTFDGGLAQGSVCVVEPYTVEVDLCTRFGLTCQPNAFDRTSWEGTCELPTTGQPCKATPGCATGNVCLTGGPGGGSVCTQTCATTDDCTRLDEVCGTVGGQSVCTPAACGGSALFSACALDGIAGTCLPPPTGASTVDVCYAAGSAGPSGPCSATREPDGGALECPALTLCTSSYAGSGCLPVCTPTPVDGGPPPCNGVCAPLSATDGVCLAACTTNSDCPAPMRCAAVTTFSYAVAQGCTY
jgi:erythromycin esterase